MAGSPEYLKLLEDLKHTFTNTGSTGDAYDSLEDYYWPELERAFNNGRPLIPPLWHIARISFDIVARETRQTYAEVIEEARLLHIAKNAGYAGQDNKDAWANFRRSQAFGVRPTHGVLVRMSDKFIRIQNLRRNPQNEMVGEAIIDTVRDLAAYALIAICLLREPA